MESYKSTKDFEFPKRPKGANNTGQPIQLLTNYFRFLHSPASGKTSTESAGFNKYAILIEPELPGDSVRLRSKIWRAARPEIKTTLSHTIFNNNTCYSKVLATEEISVKVSVEEADYTVIVKWANRVEEKSEEALGLYKKFFGQLVRKIDLVQIRRNFFQRGKSQTIENIEVWQGFSPTVNLTSEGILLNVSVVHKVLRPDSALGTLQRLAQGRQNDGNLLANEYAKVFNGAVVLTRYNNDKTYIVDHVALDKSPLDKFVSGSDGTEKSYVEYYREKYGREIKNNRQPLLAVKDKRKNDFIYLVPELCFMTGLTDEMRSNFNVMKKLAEISSGNPEGKLNECKGLIRQFYINERCKKDCENWEMKVGDEPIKVTGYRLNAGNYLMRNGSKSFSAEDFQNVDRNIQDEMYSQPRLHTWMVVAQRSDQNAVNNFLNNFKQVISTFKYQAEAPRRIEVNSRNSEEWIKTIQNTIGQVKVQLIVLIIPGPKGRNTLYNDLKRNFTCDFPVPCQCIISNTLMKERGLRSVVNKILMQMCAKIGGEPWAMDKLPFVSSPTMIVGIDVYNKNGKSIVACCASFNNRFTKYASIVKQETQGRDLDAAIRDSINEAIEMFKTANSNTAPTHIIIFRSGLTPSLIATAGIREIQAIRASLNVNGNSNIKLTFICLNNKNVLKLYALNQNGSIAPIQPGTVVDSSIISTDKYEFYLVSQKAMKGIPQATHYFIVYDECDVRPAEIQMLVYKLCYLYYNWTGGVKIPAPCQYARRLAMLVGDKFARGDAICMPSDKFIKEIKSLYFL